MPYTPGTENLLKPSTNQMAPLGLKQWVGSHEIGVTLPIPAGAEFAVEVMYGRFGEAFAATGGLPVYVAYDATYGHFCFLDTHHADHDYKCAGITLPYSQAPAIGEYGWIQCGGLNATLMTTSEAAAVGAVLNPVNGATTVESADSDAERLKKTAVLLGPALGAGGSTGVGGAYVTGNL